MEFKFKRGILVISMFILIVLASLAYAQIPRKLSVEGRLLDLNNNPKTGTFVFNL